MNSAVVTSGPALVVGGLAFLERRVGVTTRMRLLGRDRGGTGHAVGCSSSPLAAYLPRRDCESREWGFEWGLRSLAKRPLAAEASCEGVDGLRVEWLMEEEGVRGSRAGERKSRLIGVCAADGASPSRAAAGTKTASPTRT